MGLLDMFRRKPPIDDATALATFIDRQAAFVVQKGIYEYSQARSGHYAKVLFAESGFRDAVERARWAAYPMGLAMVGEAVEGILRPHAGDDRRAMLDGLISLVLAVYDRYPVSPSIGEPAWSEARADLARQIDLIGTHPPKRAKDIPEQFAERYFALMPIHETLRGRDFPTLRNYLRVTMCNVHDEFTKRMDAAALTRILIAGPAA